MLKDSATPPEHHPPTNITWHTSLWQTLILTLSKLDESDVKIQLDGTRNYRSNLPSVYPWRPNLVFLLFTRCCATRERPLAKVSLPSICYKRTKSSPSCISTNKFSSVLTTSKAVPIAVVFCLYLRVRLWVYPLNL